MSEQSSSVSIAIIMGSRSDWPIMQHTTLILDEFQLDYHVEVISAHRTPERSLEFAQQAASLGYKIIIAGAGGAAHLPGILAANTLLPVLGVPMPTASLNGVDSLYSIVQMPRGIPVGTLAIGQAGAANAALLAIQILALNCPELTQKLAEWRHMQKQHILAHADPREE